MNHNFHIDYANVALRPLSIDDIEKLRIWRNDTNNSKYLSKNPYITPKMQDRWFKEYLFNEDEVCFAIVEKCNLNRLVGSLSLYDFEDKTCFFGKILIGDPEAHGRKVGLNASKAAIQIAHEQLYIREIKLLVFPENIAACKIYKDAGFILDNEHVTSEGKREYLMTICLENQKNA